MEDVNKILEAARDAYGRRDWPNARDRFNAARQYGVLSADDVYALADSAWWLGLVDESLNAYEEAYRLYLHGAQPRRAAMSAVEVAVSLFLRGDDVIGSGWITRARRLLRDEPPGIEHAWMVYFLEVEAELDGADVDEVIAKARQVQDIGRRFTDPSLVALGVVGEGRALIRQGRVAEGMGLLDEAMLAALSDELDPGAAGNIYCHLMSACHELADLRRMRVWTKATADWCERLPAAVLFTGICRVHRAQVLQVQGAWARAEQEARRVCQDLADIHGASVAEACYALGDLARMRGDLSGADEAFTLAHQHGRDPQPGLALLRLAQGRGDTAAASITAALAGTRERLARARLCAAQVEIALAIQDTQTARLASDELNATASTYGTPGLEAAAWQVRGAVLLAEGSAGEALPVLRSACQRWQELHAPYDAARVRLLLTRAYDALGDEDAADRELDAAEAVFVELGATLDARMVAELRGRPALPGGLTEREAEVLTLVAVGSSNREVATSLVISEKTVARHLSNIFTKLGLSSRTEAAAYAFEHGLTSPTRG